MSLVYNEETETVSGKLVVEASTSLYNELKEGAQEAAKNGGERPIGGAVPHFVEIEFKDVSLEEVGTMATKPVVIRVQNKEKKKYKTPEAFENGLNGKTLKTTLKATKRGISAKERMLALAAGLTPEQAAEFIKDPEKYIEENF